MNLSQVFIVVELRTVFQVTLEFLLTQELLYPLGYIKSVLHSWESEKLRFSEGRESTIRNNLASISPTPDFFRV